MFHSKKEQVSYYTATSQKRLPPYDGHFSLYPRWPLGRGSTVPKNKMFR